MFRSVTLKRSLQQISKAQNAARCSLSSQAATHWEGSADTEDTANGIIRFTMTPKAQHASLSRGFGTTKNQDLEHHYNAVDNPFFDRTAAAEQMAKQMEDSYYYASFKATKGSEKEQQHQHQQR